MNLVLEFPHNYEVVPSPDLPGSGGRVIYFPGAKSGGKDGVVVRVKTEESGTWFGVFAFGEGGCMEANGIYSCPDPDQLCVASGGDAYFVDARNPTRWSQVPVAPVLDVRCIPSKEMLIFVDFSTISAFGPNGLLWRTSDLALDGVSINVIEDDSIRGIGTCLCTDDTPAYEFVVDLTTGKHTGGWPR